MIAGKIISIKKKIYKKSTIPNGIYTGFMSGNSITIIFNNETYKIESSFAIRGINVKVVVTIENENITFN